jgi:hypothetical protein
MRRLGVLVPLLLLAGCDSLKDAFTARPEVAAAAADQKLPVERLGGFMAGVKGLPVNHEAAKGIAGMWIEHMLFAQALAAGQDLNDSAFAADALWPELVELRASRWHDTLLARRFVLDPAQADSLYAADTERILQHLLIRAKADAPAAERQAARRKAEQARSQVVGGATFAAVAEAVSEDPSSKVEGGYLSMAPRGNWVTAFDSAGWALPVGGMSQVVETPFGYHVVRRPPLGEVRDRILAVLRQREGLALDSLYLDSLGVIRELSVSGNAPAFIRSAIADMDGASRSTKVLARWKGGVLTVSEFARWLNAIGPGFINDVATRPDSALTQLAQAIGQNSILVAEATEEGVNITAADWTELAARHRGRVDTLTKVLALGPEMFDSAATPSERARVAALAVEKYWDQVAEGKGRPFPAPGPFGLALRARGDYRFYPAGLERALAVATELRALADSLEAQPRIPNVPRPTVVPPPAP